jgi:hypothetical protein
VDSLLRLANNRAADLFLLQQETQRVRDEVSCRCPQDACLILKYLSQ